MSETDRPAAPSLADYRALEAELAARPWHWPVVALAIAMTAIFALLVPLLPEPALRMMDRRLGLADLTAIVLFDIYIGVFVTVYYLGCFDLLRVWVGPVEARSLSLLLAKPIRRVDYLRAKLAPIATRLALLGTVMLAGKATLAWLMAGAFPVVAFVAASAIVLASSLAFVAVMNLVFLFFRESYAAILVATAAMMAPFIALTLQLYRPDVWVDREGARDLLTFPANLVRFPDAAPLAAAIVVPACGAIAIVAVALAARRLERIDAAG